MKKILVKNTAINFVLHQNDDFISLTDIAKYKNPAETALVISHWMSTKFTVEFLGIWEQIHNQNFNTTEFSSIKNQSGSNGFVLTVGHWVKTTKAIGIFSKAGRYNGGTFAHKDIAFEFASWVSPEFKLYLIKEFQRLKDEESKRLSLGWNVKRQLTKLNYKIHTDAIKNNLIPEKISPEQANIIYASEADVLNIALFGMTARQWREKNPKTEGNIRDYADVVQLVCLANLEVLNAEFIKQGLPQTKRLFKLNESAISQMESFLSNSTIQKLS